MLKSGIYEQVINRELGKELDVETDKLKFTAPMDSAEASKVLAKYISDVIEKGLDNVKDNGGDLQTQLSLANKIVSTIVSETGEGTINMDEQISKLKKTIKDMENEKEKTFSSREQLKLRNQSLKTGLLPERLRLEREKSQEIEARFSLEYIRNTGESRYQSELQRLHAPQTILNNFKSNIEQSKNHYEDRHAALVQRRREFAFDFAPCSFDAEAVDNDEYQKELQLLTDVALPQYQGKIKEAYESAMEQFQNDFLAKLKANIDAVYTQVSDLNHDPGTILMHKTNHPYTKYTLIFDRKMSFAENTMKRIARGNQKFVIDNPEPFIVPIGYGERKGQAPRINSIEQPLNTIVSSCKPISLYACNDRHRATLDDVLAFLN